MTTSTDEIAEFQAALWDAAQQHRVEIDSSSQVAVARRLAMIGHERVTSAQVRDAFAAQGLSRPSVAYADEVVGRVRRHVVRASLRDVLLEYRAYAIDALSSEFGGDTKGHEERLRNNLRTYLPRHGFVEARTGRGETDILIPGQEVGVTEALIEVKVWDSPSYHAAGLEEMKRYIRTLRPKSAYMVVFGERSPLPSIVTDHNQEIAEEPTLEGLVVPVIVVLFEVDQASKARRNERKRRKERDGGK